jgi:dipeptidyl aminopeptidase/acylaminoacyl peptidase
LPEGVDNPPLFIWIGGGAWAFVNRHQEMEFARKMAAEGIAVASIGHRLSPGLWRDSTRSEGIQHPEHIKDVAKAFSWLYDKASKYGYDRDRIFIGGFSSGAHLATLLSMDTRYLESVGLKQENIKGFIPVSGGYDIVSYYEVFVNGPNPAMAKLHVQAVFGETEEDLIDASPITYLENMKVPMLMFSENMTYNYTKIFEDALRETEFRDFEVIHVHKLGHADLWRNLSFEDESPYRDRIVEFILR